MLWLVRRWTTEFLSFGIPFLSTELLIDALVLLPVTQILPSTQMFERSNESLGRGHPIDHHTGLISCRSPLMSTVVEPHVVILSLPGIVTCVEDFFEERDLLRYGWKDQVRHRIEAMQLGDDFECVALVNEEALALGRVVHLLRVFRHKRVKERVEPFVVTSLGSEDTTQPLSFLTTRSEMGRNLDQTSGFGQVDRSVSDL